MTSDSQDVFIDLKGASDITALDFANLYFSTTLSGSDVGFEIGNHDTFVPGVPGSFSTAGDGITYTTTSTEWDITIPWSVFTSNPQNLSGYTDISAANDVLRLNLSQTFGYSVAGGQADYGSTELGEVTYAAAPDSASTIAMLGATVAGLAALRRRFSR
jgi:hypothetical protein